MFFVSPAGNDEWSGTAVERGAKADGPFLTAQRALQAVARVRQEKPDQAVAVRFRGGIYRLNAPLTLTSAHGGTASAPVTLEAYGDERPIFSGGRAIKGWKPSADHPGWWAAPVPGVREGNWFFRDLWVHGERAVRARQPNAGSYLKVAGVPDATQDWTKGQTRFAFAEQDVPPGPFPFGAEAIVASRWVESRLPIKSVEPGERLVAFDKRSQFTLQVGDSYWLEGDGRWLDTPGEWFLDRDAGVIYYMPRPGETPESLSAVAPVGTQLLTLTGDADRGRPIEFVTLRDLTFSHCHFNWPETGDVRGEPPVGGFAQADLPVSAAIAAAGIRHCTFDRLRIEHVGSAGLELASGCSQNRIARCTFRDLAAGGIKIGTPVLPKDTNEQTFGNEVADCEIADGGKRFTSAVGIWVGQSFDNAIRFNHIHDFYYSGLSLGWTWGYGDSLNRGNLVERNHVHHIGRLANGDGPILSDMGGIYTLGARQGTVIRDNHFHDIAASKYGGWGIYLDEGSSSVLVSGNLVHHTTNGGFHLHYGANNLVTGNIFALARDAQLQRTREEPTESFQFTHNLVYWPGGSPLLLKNGKNMRFSQNVYGPLQPSDFRAGDQTWTQWRAAGQDEGTTFVGECFANPGAGDFSPKRSGPAAALPAVPTPEQVGPRDETGHGPRP